jgi:hypothetical protein
MSKSNLIEKTILNKEEKGELLRLRDSSKASRISLLERKKKYRQALCKLNSIAFLAHSFILSAISITFLGSSKTETYPEKIFKYSGYGICVMGGLGLVISSGRKVGANHILYKNYKLKISQLNSSNERV